MKASTLNPVYTVYIVTDSKKYDVTPAVIFRERVESENEIAQRITLELHNVEVEGVRLSGLLQPVNRVFVYADDGTKNDEVFRGFLWERNYKSSVDEQTLKVTAFDHLIYLQESEDTFYFSDNQNTRSRVETICRKWNVKLNYQYLSIPHSKLPASGRLYDILTSDIMDEAKRRIGRRYAIISDKDTMYVKTAGSNELIYKFVLGENVISASSSWTMQGVVTKVIVVGKSEEDEDREKVESTKYRNTQKYGTLQKIEQLDEEAGLSAAEENARHILDESSSPKWEYEIVAPDIPWIRKGDAVFIDAGDIRDRRLIVKTIRRSGDRKTSKMTMTMVDPT